MKPRRLIYVTEQIHIKQKKTKKNTKFKETFLSA